jgi:glycerate 2-kinase
LRAPDERVLVLGAGKAAAQMAHALSRVLGRAVEGFVVTKYGHASARDAVRGVEVWEAGHPVPDASSVRAGTRMLAESAQAGPGALVFVLLSGGGSALCCAPRVSLGSLQEITRALLASGAPIHEINAVRRSLDPLKGGGLLQALSQSGCRAVVSLLLSDVVGDDPRVIASGLTTPPEPGTPTGADVLASRGLLALVSPETRAEILRAVGGEEEAVAGARRGEEGEALGEARRGEEAVGEGGRGDDARGGKEGGDVGDARRDSAEHGGSHGAVEHTHTYTHTHSGSASGLRHVRQVIASNRHAVDAAAREAVLRGYRVIVAARDVQGEAKEVGKLLGSMAAAAAAAGSVPDDPPGAWRGPHESLCVLMGGETTVTLPHEHGQGGRNMELALAAALQLRRPDCVVFAAATDGSDGPTHAAGAILSRSALDAAQRAGLDPAAALRRHDALTFLSQLQHHAAHALLVTGPTGTNVIDLFGFLVRPTP